MWTWLGLRFVPTPPPPAAQAARSLMSTLSPVWCALFPPRTQPQFPSAGWVSLVSVCGAGLKPHPSQQKSTIQNLRKSLVRNWEPVCSLVGDAVSKAEFAPFPSPLPPASVGDGPACHRLALLQNCSVFPLFLPLAGGGCERLGYYSTGTCF